MHYIQALTLPQLKQHSINMIEHIYWTFLLRFKRRKSAVKNISSHVTVGPSIHVKKVIH